MKASALISLLSLVVGSACAQLTVSGPVSASGLSITGGLTKSGTGTLTLTGTSFFGNATVYVDSVYGNDSTGVPYDSHLKYATGQAAYNAASSGDKILFGKGTFTLTATSSFKAGIKLEGDGGTNLTVTLNNATDLTEFPTFTYFDDASITITGTSALALPEQIKFDRAYLETDIDAPSLDLNNCSIRNYRGGGTLINYNPNTTGTATGAMTFYGNSTVGAGASLMDAAPSCEVYFVNAGNHNGTIYSDDGSTKGGEVNVVGGYNMAATAATVRMQNAGFATRSYTTLVDGGGNHDEGADIIPPTVPLVSGSAAFKLGGTNYYPHVAAGVLSFTSTP